MALHDLLQSITHEADQRIADAKNTHASHMQSLQTEHNASLEKFRHAIEERSGQMKRSLREKAASLGRISASKLLLSHKNEALNEVYGAVLEHLKKLPKDKLSAFFTACLSLAGDTDGVIRAAKEHEALLRDIAGKNFTFGPALEKSEGGFTVSSSKREWNFTFDFLVSQSLRPATEIDAAAKLFAA